MIENVFIVDAVFKNQDGIYRSEHFMVQQKSLINKLLNILVPIKIDNLNLYADSHNVLKIQKPIDYNRLKNQFLDYIKSGGESITITAQIDDNKYNSLTVSIKSKKD